MKQQIAGWALFTIIVSHSALMTLAAPQQPAQQIGGHFTQQHHQIQPNRYIPSGVTAEHQNDYRKFAEKPNSIKKVALDDIDEDIQTNQISDNGFSWSNMLGKDLSFIIFLFH